MPIANDGVMVILSSPSGAGKTTLVNLLCGLLDPSEGEIYYDNTSSKEIDIRDNGPGIPSNLKDKVFIPIVSGHASNSGLGLSIAQSIVNQHNGLIAFTSEVGDTCFSIYLPMEISI